VYGAEYNEDECPSYIAIYKTVRSTCREQRSIVDKRDDSILSSVFEALPRLNEVRLSFCEVLEEYGWVLQSLASDMVMEQEFYKHHLQVVSRAIKSARRKGVAIRTIILLDFDLPYYDVWEVPDLSTLSEHLRQLLVHIKVLRLRGSDFVLELLSQCALDLYQLDLCRVVASENGLQDCFETNKRTLRSIGFHNVQISSSPLGSSRPMSSSMLCGMLNMPPSTRCQAADCGCLPWLKEGSRLVFSNDHCSVLLEHPAKRKFVVL
jgi:hypothetical protein